MYEPVNHRPPARRRVWPFVAPLLLVVLLGLAWSGVWFYSRALAEDRIAHWLEREADLGRVYRCGSQRLGGFPFRIEFRCADAQAELKERKPPLAVTAGNVLVAAQIYQPSLLLGEIAGPVTVGEPDRPAVVANWSLAQTSLRGNPRAPQRVSIVLEAPVLDRVGAPAAERLFSGTHAELHGRLAAGALRDRPVIDLAISLVGAVAPSLHPLAARPVDLDLDTTVHGLGSLSPRSLVDRLREIQANGGRIDVKHARLKQGDIVAVASGALRLTEHGRLDGDLTVTAAGLDKLLAVLGRGDVLRAKNDNNRMGQALSALDRLMSGMSPDMRERAAAVAGLGVVAVGGEAVELEGRRAVRLPLRLRDGTASLGPIPLGQVPPLF
jgi:hypothetical protein